MATVLTDPRIMQLVETAEIRDASKALAGVMTCIAFWYNNRLDIREHRNAIKKIVAVAAEFYVEFRFTKPTLQAIQSITEHMLANKTPSDDDDEKMGFFGSIMAGFDPKFQKATEIPSDTLKYIRAAAQFFRNASENAWSFLEKNVSEIVPFLAKNIEVPMPTQHAEVKELADLIEKLTKRRDIRMTEDEKDKWRAKNPTVYQRVLELQRHVDKSSDIFLRNYARTQPDHRVLYSEMLKVFHSSNVIHFWPNAKNWDGYIDENGVLYTMEGAEIIGKPSFTIVGNPKYDPEAEKFSGENAPFYCITSKGNQQYFYVKEKRKGWKAETFEKVDMFVDVLDDVRASWLKDVKGGSRLRKKYVLGVLCELMYWTSARIGSEGNQTSGKATFGMTTIRGKMVRKEGANLIIEYTGKSGVHQKHILIPKTPEQKIVARQVLTWAEEAPNAVVFDLREAHETPPSNGAVNGYLRAHGAPAGVTIHKIRHARATKIMGTQMEKCPYYRKSQGNLVPNASKKPEQKEAEEWYKSAALEVGRELGHSSGEKVTWSTAVAAYINPTTTTGFFSNLGLRLPSWAQKFED